MTEGEVAEAVEEAATPVARRPRRIGFVTVPRPIWRHRWLVSLTAWAILVALAYAAVGGHLNPALTITGLLVGFLVGLTGMGGGALMTPILILFFGFSPTTAIGTDITYAAVTKVVGSWRHRRLGSVDMPLALWLAAGSVPAALLGVAAVTYVRDRYGDVINGILYRAIGGALLAVAILLVVKVVMHVDQEAHHCVDIRMTTRRKIATVALGFFCGFVIGLTSVGSGTFLAVFLILFYPLTTDRIVGTDVFHAMILLCITGLAQIGVGNVDLWMVAALLMGSIPGVLVGSQLTKLAPNRLLRLCLAAVLFLSGLALLGKA